MMHLQKDIIFSDAGYLHRLQYFFFGSILLYWGRDLFIPVSFALLISFVLYPVCAWMERKGINRLVAIFISIVLLILLGLLLVALLVNQFLNFLDDWPTLQVKIVRAWSDLSLLLTQAFGISKSTQDNFISQIVNQSGSNFVAVMRNAISASAFSFVLLILIPVYAVLIIYYRQHWMKVLIRLFPEERSESLYEIVFLTVRAYYNFIKGMAIVYVAVGILNSVGLLILGVPHAILFGFIASILTFIPYVGIIVGSLLPITMAWITYDSIWYPVGIIGIFTFVQYLEANIIFPLAVSNRLNVNPLVMLLSIFAGGIIWGMAGMILFVPFVGIIKLIADHNPKWKTVSLFLGVENTRA